MNMLEVSIIISARNEFPVLAMTITNLMINMDASGIKRWEIIIADNGSSDDTTRFFTHQWAHAYAKHANNQVPFMYREAKRGMVVDGRLRFVYDPYFSNVGARHNAVKYAKYSNIIFADGHIDLKKDSIKYALNTLNAYGGIVHLPVAWMGSSIKRPVAGMQYSYKIGEKIWGTWNRYAVTLENPFYIPVSGHCFIAVKKKEYLKFGGYDNNQQIYGGGENYLDTLYWMMGSTVMCDPRGMVFHLSAGRNYSYVPDSLIHNMMMTAYALGGHKWSERLLITYLNKPNTNKEVYKKLYKSALEHGEPKRQFIAKNAKYTLEQVLGLGEGEECDGHCYKGQKHIMRPWDKLNQQIYGKHISFVQVFEDWLGRLTDSEAIQIYKNSPHQV